MLHYADLDEDMLPGGVKRSLKEWYKILNRCVVAGCKQPTKTKWADTVLFKVLEACIGAFYGLHHHTDEEPHGKCLWDYQDLNYTGLCNHSSLREASLYRSKLGLSEEVIAAEVKATRVRIAKRVRKYGLFYRSIAEVKK